MNDRMIDSFLDYNEPDPFELRIGGEEDTDTREKFEVDTIDKAEWAVKKIARYEAKTAEYKEFAEREIDRIKEWFDRQKKFNDGNVEFLKSLLKPYAETQLKDSKRKSLDLPSGTLKFTKGRPKFEMADEALLKYFKDNNATQFIETKETPKWGEFKKTIRIEDGRAISKDGEILDFITVTEPEDSFTVKLNEL